MTHRVDRPRWPRTIFLAGLGVLLIWQIVTRSFAAYLATEAPASALAVRPDEPTALVALADATLNPRIGADDEKASRKELDDTEQRASAAADRIGGWSEVALKAAASKLPLESGREVPPAAAAASAPVSEEDKALVRKRAEQALVQEPLNARALRILGQLADKAGDEVRTAKLMRAAANRSLGESVAVYWLMQNNFATGDYAQAVSYADMFLRKRPQLMVHAVPVLGRIAESDDKDGIAALKKILAQNPPWRAHFFSDLPRGITDARTPLNLMLSLKDSAAPPSKGELGRYLRFLIQRKLYELAYYSWLQFLPAYELGRIGYLANPGFETEPSGLPFDWVISQGAGVTVDIAAVPGAADARALLLDLGPGRVDFGGVTQLLMLTPGTYRLEGRFKGESRGKRGLQWNIRCAGKRGPPLGEGPMFVGVALVWKEFGLTFTVPAADCRAQDLRLILAARSASEQLVSGSVWYDDLRITRMPEGEAQR